MYTIHHGQSPASLSERVNTAATQTLRLGLRSANTTNYSSPQLSTRFGERAFIRRTGSIELSATCTQSCTNLEHFQICRPSLGSMVLLADRTNGRAIGTLLRPSSSVCRL